MSYIPDAPLIEAVFELRWGESPDKPGEFMFTPFDYQLPRMLAGKLKVLGFDWHENLYPNSTDPRIASHRFSAANELSPCVQVGTGLLTVNMLGNPVDFPGLSVPKRYDWDDFLPYIASVVDLFNDAYPGGLGSLPGAIASLRFLDAFKLGSQNSVVLAEKIWGTNLGIVTDIANLSNIKANPKDINFKAIFESDSPKAEIELNSYYGTVLNVQSLIVETNVSSQIPPEDISCVQLVDWCKKVHATAIEIFRLLLKNKEKK